MQELIYAYLLDIKVLVFSAVDYYFRQFVHNRLILGRRILYHIYQRLAASVVGDG